MFANTVVNKANMILFNLILLTVLLTSVSEHSNIIDGWYGELGIIEIIQILFLVAAVVLSFIYKKLLLKYTSKSIFYLRNIFLIALIYEEASFTTTGLLPFMSEHNKQNEINFHNLELLDFKVIDNIPVIGDVHFLTVIILALFLFVSLGNYLPIGKSYKFLLLDKRINLYGLFYLIELGLTKILILTGIFRPTTLLINHELKELITYIIVFLDTFIKIFKNKFFNE